jgi:peptidoglycan/LPS O-acetylase OafA/YrhL
MDLTIKQKFQLLDGYRGFAANLVLIQHTLKRFSSVGDYKVFRWTGTYIGVSAFFVLSAFLLTYRLTIDLSKAKSNRQILLCIIQYFIRRFFRIYLVFLIFWTLLHFGPQKMWLRGFYSSYSSYTNAFTLSFLGRNHFWTCLVEIKYYLFIPVFVLIITKTQKYWYLTVTLTAILILIQELFNPFKLKKNDYLFWDKNYAFVTRIPVFLTGSLFAILYINLKQINFTIRESSYFKNFVAYGTLFLFFLQFRIFSDCWSHRLSFYRYNFPSGLFQTVFLAFLLILNDKNFMYDFFNSRYLTLCGKYSFGIYLVHPAFIKPIGISILKFRFIYQAIFYVLISSFIFGMVWFYVCENVLINFANYLCKKLENSNYFREPETNVSGTC